MLGLDHTSGQHKLDTTSPGTTPRALALRLLLLLLLLQEPPCICSATTCNNALLQQHTLYSYKSCIQHTAAPIEILPCTKAPAAVAPLCRLSPPLSGSGALTLLAAVTCSSCDMHQHAHSNLHDSKAIHGLTEVHQLHTTPSTPAVHLLPPVAHHTSGPAWSATARTMQTACRHRRRLPSTNTKNTAAIRSDDHSPRAASWIFLVAIIKTSCSG